MDEVIVTTDTNVYSRSGSLLPITRTVYQGVFAGNIVLFIRHDGVPYYVHKVADGYAMN
jgi:hemin uptake protein HemP